MIPAILLCAFAGLLPQAAVSSSLPSRALAADGIPVPKFKTDFQKGNVSAQWAEGYPKQWGAEDSRFDFGGWQPELYDFVFNGIVTEDEKYLAMINGTHATFVDLDSNATVSTFALSPGVKEAGNMIRSLPQGGYELWTSEPRIDGDSNTYQRRLTSELKPTGELSKYRGGFRALQGSKMVANTFKSYIIYDLSSPNRTGITLSNPPAIYDISFSSDARYLSSVGWTDRSADLWNTTTGEKILQFPKTNAQNWITRISPDDRYVFLGLGTGYVQVYALANLTAEPIVLDGFNNWVRQAEWSPDGKYLATGDSDRMRIWKFPEVEVVQTWQLESPRGLGTWQLAWLDGGRKFSFMYRYGRYMYDFETNLKYWWTPGYSDATSGDGSVTFLKKRGWVGTMDGDARVRFWKV
jgi:WD40 repeat protein